MNLDPTKERIPLRIQRKRVKGWRKPYDTVNCTRPGPFGNPFKVGDPGIETKKDAVRAFAVWLETTAAGRITYNLIKLKLPGKNLMCFCGKEDDCHVDLILEIANS